MHSVSTRIFLAALLPLAACGGDPEIEGTVMGSSLGDKVSGLAVHRLANTPLSPDVESLDLYFGDGFISLCPDIGEPTGDETTLIFALVGPKIAAGSFPLCDGFDCQGSYLDIGFDGWRLPSGETVTPTGGSAELTKFDGGRAVGTFDLDFDGEAVHGEFDLDIECVDSRPRP